MPILVVARHIKRLQSSRRSAHCFPLCSLLFLIAYLCLLVMTVLTHIVLFKYKPSVPWPELQRHFESFEQLPKKCVKPDGKPYLKSLKMGMNLSWQAFNKGMTHGFIIEFESQEDHDFYHLEDPVHIEFSKNAAGLVEDSVVVDIKDGVLFGSKPKKPGKAPGVYRGSCHCGQVEWLVKLDTAEHILCHCGTCQKLGGGPYSMNQIVHQDDLRIIQGQLKTYTYTGASGNPVNCYYCDNCTSHVYHHQAVMHDKIIVRTMLLDGGGDMEPSAEIFAEGKLPWIQDIAGLST
ncbi:Mss4-like protein [Camillea tinctor]|nr:Mss4-like protein [Camillea tinctor]